MQATDIGLIILIGLLALSLITASIPYTTSQFIDQTTDLNYILFEQGAYDQNCLIIDGNKISVSDCNSGGTPVTDYLRYLGGSIFDVNESDFSGKFLRDDGNWATITSGSGTDTNIWTAGLLNDNNVWQGNLVVDGNVDANYFIGNGSLLTGISGGASFGTDNQIPYTNAAGDDFDYSANYTFDGTSLLLTGKLKTTNASLQAPALTYNRAEYLEFANSGASLVGGVDSVSPYGFYLQNRQNSTSDLAYPLLLNPMGGRVGVGTRTFITTHTVLQIKNNGTKTVNPPDAHLVLDAGQENMTFDIGGAYARQHMRMFGGTSYSTGPAFQLNSTGSTYQGMYFDAGSATGANINFRNASSGTIKTILQLKQGGISAYMPNDNGKLFFGAGDDASISYDGTNMVINPKVVGSGNVQIQGDMNVTGNYYSNGFVGLTRNNRIVKDVNGDGTFYCDMNYVSGLLIGSNC